MSNSSLICYTRISPNKTHPRNHKNDTITIHHMAGNMTIENCGNLFSSIFKRASSNYGIGTDGRIGLYVEESDRSWCSSNKANDNRAVTIEVANDGRAETNWHVSDAALESLIDLCTDICKRNDIKKLLWLGDKTLIGKPEKQNITVHKWFSATSCPGPYLYGKLGYVAEQVNKNLLPKTKTSTEKVFEVRASGIAYAYDKSLAGKYTATADLCLRNAGGLKEKLITVIPKGSIVQNYGYYTVANKMNWLYVQLWIGNTLYTGFSSANYLKRKKD